MSDEPPAPAGPIADAPDAAAVRPSPRRHRPPERAPASHWALHPAVVLGSLVLCFPIGFVLVWLTAWDVRSKVIAAAAGTLLAVLLAVSTSATPPWVGP